MGVNNDLDRLDIALQVVQSYLGTPYKWAGDDPSGIDCSGLAVETLKSCGKLPPGNKFDLTAQGLLDRFISKRIPFEDRRPGCMMFFGKNVSRVWHVEFLIKHDFTIGASGGGSETKSELEAWEDNAFVKIRPLKSRGNLVAVIDLFQRD